MSKNDDNHTLRFLWKVEPWSTYIAMSEFATGYQAFLGSVYDEEADDHPPNENIHEVPDSKTGMKQ